MSESYEKKRFKRLVKEERARRKGDLLYESDLQQMLWDTKLTSHAEDDRDTTLIRSLLKHIQAERQIYERVVEKFEPAPAEHATCYRCYGEGDFSSPDGRYETTCGLCNGRGHIHWEHLKEFVEETEQEIRDQSVKIRELTQELNAVMLDAEREKEEPSLTDVAKDVEMLYNVLMATQDAIDDICMDNGYRRMPDTMFKQARKDALRSLQKNEEELATKLNILVGDVVELMDKVDEICDHIDIERGKFPTRTNGRNK